jgi:MFS family permease
MAKRPLRWYDLITINIYWMGLTTLSQTNGLVFPLLIQQFVGENEKASYLGMLRLWTLMVALLLQSMMGLVSDRSRASWGRRRPFIFTGTIFDLIFLFGVGLSAGFDGLNGFWVLFIMALLLQISSNTAHAAQQGLIPDLVPEARRGLYSGVKALLELPVPLILVSFTIGRLIATGNLWVGLLVAGSVLMLTMLLTMLVPEKKIDEKPQPINWVPFFRLLLMTSIFTVIILISGETVKIIGGYLKSNSISIPVQIIVVGMAGLIGMIVAVAIGVWYSIQIGIGKELSRRNPSFSWWVMNRLAFLVGATNLSTFAVFFIQARLGYERETAAGPAAILMLVVGVFILIFALPAGWISDRIGKKPVVIFSSILAAVGTFVALLFPNITTIYIGGILIGSATGLFFTANWALGTSIVPKADAGRFLGISNLAGAGAGAVGAYIGGPIADYFTLNVPTSPGLGYLILFGIYGIIFLLSSISLKWVTENQNNIST